MTFTNMWNLRILKMTSDVVKIRISFERGKSSSEVWAANL